MLLVLLAVIAGIATAFWLTGGAAVRLSGRRGPLRRLWPGRCGRRARPRDGCGERGRAAEVAAGGLCPRARCGGSWPGRRSSLPIMHHRAPESGLGYGSLAAPITSRPCRCRRAHVCAGWLPWQVPRVSDARTSSQRSGLDAAHCPVIPGMTVWQDPRLGAAAPRSVPIAATDPLAASGSRLAAWPLPPRLALVALDRGHVPQLLQARITLASCATDVTWSVAWTVALWSGWTVTCAAMMLILYSATTLLMSDSSPVRS